MPSLNKVQLIGRLGADPEKRFTPTGKAVTSFRIAVDRRWRNAEGEWKEATEWINIETWGRLAENSEKYLSKGRLVYVEGRLQTDRYEVEGEPRSRTKVVANQMQMLERKPDEDEPAPIPAEDEGEEYPF